MNAGAGRGPVFIVGMNGSGTTMMLDHLGQHPDLYAFPLETYIMPYYIASQKQYGDLAIDDNFRRLWEEITSSYVFRVRNAGAALELPNDWRQAQRSAAGIFDKIMLEFARQHGKARWSEKTPMYAIHMLELSEAFPGSKFIHMIRDGRDCAASNLRRWGRHPLATIERWQEVIDESRRQGRKLGDRYIEMRYEDVTATPERFLREACDFLGLEFCDDVLTTGRPRVSITGQESNKIIRNTRRTSTYFSARRRKALERLAGSKLVELGYKVEFCEGNSRANPLVRSWWLIHDSCRVLWRQVRGKFTTDRRLTWSLILSRIKMILRSRRG